MRCTMSRCINESIQTLSISKGYKWGDGYRMPATEDTHIVSLCEMHLQLLNEGKLRPPQ